MAYLTFKKPEECQLITPDLVGLTLEDASNLLTKRGIKLEVSDTIYSPNTNTVLIADQVPQAGTINCDLITVRIQKSY